MKCRSRKSDNLTFLMQTIVIAGIIMSSLIIESFHINIRPSYSTLRHTRERNAEILRLSARTKNLQYGRGNKEEVYEMHQLLTFDDERTLSAKYQLGKKYLQQQLEMRNSTEANILTSAEICMAIGAQTDSIQRLLAEAESAKATLLENNMRLVHHIARYYQNRGLPHDDLVAEGVQGLMKAIDKYDATKGFRFSTYATWWVKQAVSRAIAEKSRLVRLPVHIHDLQASLNKADGEFTDINGRKATNSELAGLLGVTDQKVAQLRKITKAVLSMEQPRFKSSSKSEKSPSIADTLSGSNDEDVHKRVGTTTTLRDMRSSLFDGLTETEAMVVNMRYGLKDGRPKTLEEVGKIMEVTRERIRQIESKALLKLKANDDMTPTTRIVKAVHHGARVIPRIAPKARSSIMKDPRYATAEL